MKNTYVGFMENNSMHDLKENAFIPIESSGLLQMFEVKILESNIITTLA